MTRFSRRSWFTKTSFLFAVILYTSSIVMTLFFSFREEEEPTTSSFIPQNPAIVLSTSRPHPHAGARYADGRLGLVADPSPSRLLASSEKLMEAIQQCPQVGVEGEGGRKVLDKVRQGVVESQKIIQEAAAHNPTTKRVPPRILCLVYTVDLDFNNRNMEAVASTWAKKCDGFIAASNKTDDSIGTIDLLHQGPESYANMWQKVRSMWAHVYDHYRNKYDYFHIGGDDIYLVVDNLRAYLMGDQVDQLLKGHLDGLARHQREKLGLHQQVDQWSKSRPRPLLFGLPYPVGRKFFPYGGPGYTLNRAALELLVEKGLPNFLPNSTDSREDMFIGDALRTYGGVVMADTRDEEGAWRYPRHQADMMYNFKHTPLKHVGDFLHENLHLGGMDEVSKQTVSFHLKHDPKVQARLGRSSDPNTATEMIYRYHVLLEGLCAHDG